MSLKFRAECVLETADFAWKVDVKSIRAYISSLEAQLESADRLAEAARIYVHGYGDGRDELIAQWQAYQSLRKEQGK